MTAEDIIVLVSLIIANVSAIIVAILRAYSWFKIYKDHDYNSIKKR